MRRPAPLSAGDTIAIVSPASVIDPTLIDAAAVTISELGFEPLVMSHTRGSHGSYSGTRDQRLNDIKEALNNPSVKALLCSRGGYGAIHLLEDLDTMLGACDPKWLIGFSDISALHALWYRHNIVSIHGSMAKQLALGPDTTATKRLFEILEGNTPALEWENRTATPNRNGTVTAHLSGGNMAVLDALIGTPFNPLKPGNILFIEDIAEPVYKIERMLYHLKLSGILPGLAGLVVGHFTDYQPDRNFQTMEEMISEAVAGYRYPVAFNAPVGHIGPDNMPLLHGATVTLTVTGSHCALLTPETSSNICI